MRKWLITGLALALVVLIGSRFFPLVEEITVHGNRQYTAAQIAELAGVAHGDPLLWVTVQSASRLFDEPWIHSAVITRVWPHTVQINVHEEVPVLTDGVNAWSESGTLLPGGPMHNWAALPILAGWGAPRVTEALKLYQLLRPFTVERIAYSPAGFDITLAGRTLFTPSVDALEQQWGAFVSTNAGRVAVYPWGVSFTDEQ